MAYIGIYGGTFDPIHLGHLNLATEMLKKTNLDEIWFCPVRYSPHKIGKEVSSVKDRMAMIKIAIEGEANFKAVDFEIKRNGPSYTVDTLEELHEKYPHNHYALIIGNDSVNSFFKWKSPRRIIELADLFVGCRTKDCTIHPPPDADPLVIAALRKGLVHTSIKEVSATEIRERVRRGKKIFGLVPDKVVDYINNNQLYLMSK